MVEVVALLVVMEQMDQILNLHLLFQPVVEEVEAKLRQGHLVDLAVVVDESAILVGPVTHPIVHLFRDTQVDLLIQFLVMDKVAVAGQPQPEEMEPLQQQVMAVLDIPLVFQDHL